MLLLYILRATTWPHLPSSVCVSSALLISCQRSSVTLMPEKKKKKLTSTGFYVKLKDDTFISTERLCDNTGVELDRCISANNAKSTSEVNFPLVYNLSFFPFTLWCFMDHFKETSVFHLAVRGYLYTKNICMEMHNSFIHFSVHQQHVWKIILKVLF